MSDWMALVGAKRDLMNAAEAVDDAQRKLDKVKWEFEVARERVLKLEAEQKEEANDD